MAESYSTVMLINKLNTNSILIPGMQLQLCQKEETCQSQQDIVLQCFSLLHNSWLVQKPKRGNQLIRAQFYGSAYHEAKNRPLRNTLMPGVFPCSREFLLVRTPHYLAFLAYTASAETWCLHSKGRIVIISAAPCGKQSHDIGLGWKVACLWFWENNSKQLKFSWLLPMSPPSSHLHLKHHYWDCFGFHVEYESTPNRQ